MEVAPSLSRAGRFYLATIIGLGFSVIGESIFRLYQLPPGSQDFQWVLLAVLTLISGSASVELPRANVSISISEAFVFTAVLLYGPSAGTLTVALDGLVISLWVARRRPGLHRALFNIAAPSLSAWCSSNIFFWASGIAPLARQPASLDQILPSLILFAVVYFVLNSWLIAFVIAFQKRLNPFDVWRRGFLWLSLNYFCGASLAILLVGYNRTIDIRFVGIVVPLLLVLYFTFKTSMQRVEDANKHVDELNTLYLSTIETLAMAIDAKDQVTHGHIRRVQAYAISLAREVGIRDVSLLKAIEAAALLHDMGKLAVPEYILNKPGKLTESEFDKMKLHASIGADILSAIAFPYPVVPIVRHHHENWSGNGYPAGLKGTDIPIGARILSVVDCYDALTSDRPYRPKLTDEEAIRILLERRGTMYDPLIVDTFVRVHRRIETEEIQITPSRSVLDEIAISRKSVPPPPPASERFDEIGASSDEMITLYELARGLTGKIDMGDAGEAIAKQLKRLVPSALCVFFVHDRASNELEAAHAVGDGASTIRGLRIPIGQRLSGWVAANRQTIVNSDPVLDLGGSARPHALGLKNCLSTPLVFDERLVGVLSLYTTETAGFTDDHRRIIETVARQVAPTFEKAIELAASRQSDSITGLPPVSQLEVMLTTTQSPARTKAYSLIHVEISNLKLIIRTRGRIIGDHVLQQIAKRTIAGLRMNDVPFVSPNDAFIALLSDTDPETANVVAERIGHYICDRPVRLSDGTDISVLASVSVLCCPRDGQSLSDLLALAARRSETRESANTVVH